MQDANSILASDLIGSTVYNAADEAVGDIDDAIVSLEGNVEGVVIGVGGFLGIGKKKVAVELQQISLQTDEGGDPRLILDTTRESLQAAPEFVTAAEQRPRWSRSRCRTPRRPAWPRRPTPRRRRTDGTRRGRPRRLIRGEWPTGRSPFSWGAQICADRQVIGAARNSPSR